MQISFAEDFHHLRYVGTSNTTEIRRLLWKLSHFVSSSESHRFVVSSFGITVEMQKATRLVPSEDSLTQTYNGHLVGTAFIST